MSRNAEYQFVSTDPEELVALMIAMYEKLTGGAVQPASPERLFIQWAAAVLVQERALNNYTGNQNIPSRAEGANLNALGELFYTKTRPPAQSAICTERFWITEAQSRAILIPAGTRVSDAESKLVWLTAADIFIPSGELYADIMIECQMPGTAGNGYTTGQINRLVDLFPYYDRCENITVSDKGADEATDDEYYSLMRESEDAYSNAGSKGAYIYFAKSVSTEIADVVANSPSAGQVNLYAVMKDGTAASPEIKNAVYAACNDRYVRPLTDFVVVDDPELVPYSIALTYFIDRETSVSAMDIAAAVESAVADYTVWQCARLGRDINPSHLLGLLMQTGIKRVELAAPVFTPLRDGSDDTVPQLAAVGSISITPGGYEDG